jgi:hypothetical protein
MESGARVLARQRRLPRARPFNIAWARSVRDQCEAAGVPFFMKQMGGNVQCRNDNGFEGDEPESWPMDTKYTELFPQQRHQGDPVLVRLRDRKGGDPEEWPSDLRIREFPEVRR